MILYSQNIMPVFMAQNYQDIEVPLLWSRVRA